MRSKLYRIMMLALFFAFVAACSSDDGPSGIVDLDAGSDAAPEMRVTDMTPRLDNGCPVPAEGICDDNVACTQDSYTVDPITCTAECSNVPICEDDDGCCAPGCTPVTDNDCEPGCGNDFLDPGELCDGDCPEVPTDCNLANACETAIIIGSAETCDARCFVLPIDRCTDGDGCCPEGCVAGADSDCSSTRLTLGDICTSSHQCPTENGAVGICHGVEWDNDQESICTRPCTSASDCPSAWLCQEGLCLPPCSGSDDCTTGLTCVGPTPFDPPEFCEYQPWHPRAEQLGGPCEFGYQCRGRTDIIGGSCLSEAATGWNDGYCVQRICEDDVDCSSPGACIGGRCFEGCQAGLDCRTGYECNDYFSVGKRICAPPVRDINIGEPCAGDDECTGVLTGRMCITDQPDGYCSAPCEADPDCPASSFCDENEARCVRNCQGSSCREGYACVDLGSGSGCYPAQGGNRAVGSSCESGDQCFGYTGLYPICLQDSDGFVGGYCTAVGCLDNSDCDEGNVCLIEEGATSGNCLLGCAVDEPCRPGYSCEARGDDNVCLPGGGTGDRSIGDACSDDAQCPGECISELEDINALNGYCTQRCGGEMDPECPGGSHCVEGQCSPDCQPSDDACPRYGYSCRDLDGDFTFECVPNGGDGPQASGDVCTREWQCDRGGAVCGQVGDDRRICAVTCQMGLCPADSACDPTTNLCLPSCETTADCRVGFTCREVPGDMSDTRFCDYGIFRLGL